MVLNPQTPEPMEPVGADIFRAHDKLASITALKSPIELGSDQFSGHVIPSVPPFTRPLTGDAQRDRMLHGTFHNPRSSNLLADREQCLRALASFNQSNRTFGNMLPDRMSRFKELVCLKPQLADDNPNLLGENGRAPAVHGSLGANCLVEPPFTCRYGYNLCIGENVNFQSHCKIYDTCAVLIGDNVFLGSNVLITTDNDIHPCSKQACATSVVIGDSVWIGSNSTVTAGVRIGRCSKIITGSVVFQNVPAHSIVGGNPAKVVGRRTV